MYDLVTEEVVPSKTPITVLGAGRWGSAMAIYLAEKKFPVKVYCHSKSTFDSIKENNHSNYLKDFFFPKNLVAEVDLDKAISGARLIVVSTPIPFLRSQLENLSPEKHQIFVSINKGVERQSLKTSPEIIEEFFPENPVSHLGGPCFPDGLLDPNTPVAETLACKRVEILEYVQKIFSSSSFRIYRSYDVKGVALLGAVKNIFAIAAGICAGKKLHEEVIAVLLTRGLVEMRRLCELYGISLDTLYGLSGLGDLALTCYSPGNSHNKNFGVQLGEGKTVTQVIDGLDGTIAEGYYTTYSIYQIAQKNGLELPIIESIYNVLYKQAEITFELKQLMERPLQDESSDET